MLSVAAAAQTGARLPLDAVGNRRHEKRRQQRESRASAAWCSLGLCPTSVPAGPDHSYRLAC